MIIYDIYLYYKKQYWVLVVLTCRQYCQLKEVVKGY